MSQKLPYLLIDDDFTLNYGIIVLILYKLGLSTKKNAVLDFEKLQIFLYLVKNPSKINPLLALAGKKFTPINSQYTYTIESLSTNVDVLFDRSKLKFLLRQLAARGMLECDSLTDPKSLKYLLSPNGIQFAESLTSSAPETNKDSDFNSSTPPPAENYFVAALEVISSLIAIQSQTTTRLNAYLNTIFKGN